ncbi:MAG: sensor histidine kinase, partial [Solirubrobacteraceae bacterium]
MNDRRRVYERRWLALFTVTRAATALVATGMLALRPITDADPLLGALAIGWGAWSIAAVRLWPDLQRRPLAWLVDVVVVLALVVASGEWRSPFYLMAVSALMLPATGFPMRRALIAGAAFSVVYFAVALLVGVDWATLGSTARLESFLTHLLIPPLVVFALAHAQHLLEGMDAERERAEALALEAERRRIGWELHDSAKQRIHAAHLVLTSLAGIDGERVDLAIRELEAASADMDASLTELRTTLGGRRLEEALRRRAAELQAASGIPIAVGGRAPALPTHVAVHAFRVASEAMSNAVRHARATRLDVALESDHHRLRLAVADDGVGMPAGADGDSTGLRSMQARAEALGGRLV